MALVNQIEGLEAVIKAFEKRAAKARDDMAASVIVGYTQNYAIYVHENLEAKHPVGQAKFLEQPCRELARELQDMIREDLRSGRTMAQALLRAGLRLQRASQKLCPVDTGALKNSAFTKLESGPVTIPPVEGEQQ